MLAQPLEPGHQNSASAITMLAGSYQEGSKLLSPGEQPAIIMIAATSDESRPEAAPQAPNKVVEENEKRKQRKKALRLRRARLTARLCCLKKMKKRNRKSSRISSPCAPSTPPSPSSWSSSMRTSRLGNGHASTSRYKPLKRAYARPSKRLRHPQLSHQSMPSSKQATGQRGRNGPATG